MTLIFTATLFSSRLYNVKANGQRVQILMLCPMITGRFTFLDVGVWQRNLVNFPLFDSIGAFRSVLKKNVSKFSTQLYKCITIFQSSPSLKVFALWPIPSLSDLQEGCVILTGSCHRNPFTFFNCTYKNTTERVILSKVRICRFPVTEAKLFVQLCSK